MVLVLIIIITPIIALNVVLLLSLFWGFSSDRIESVGDNPYY